MADFSSATVLITGAASGIGAATARLLQEQGASLIAMDQDAAGLEAFPGARTLVGDVADPELWERADLSGLTHAVLNAGITGRGRADIINLDFAEWREVLATNLDGSFLGLQSAMRALKRGASGSAIVPHVLRGRNQGTAGDRTLCDLQGRANSLIKPAFTVEA